MIIYCIKNIKNEKQLIGQTTHSLEYRKRHHVWAAKNNKHGNLHFQRSWNKYGEGCFKFEVIEECDSLERLNKREKYWIDECGDYNIQPGGENFILDEETRKKYSKVQRKRHKENPMTDKTKRKIGEANSISLKGRSLTDEHKENISKNSKRNKEVHKFNLDGDYLETYRSLREAARQNDTVYTNIRRVTEGKGKTAVGFKWGYNL